jgi:hypothetical protein
MWESVKNISELLKFLAILIAIWGIAYWWWINRSRTWWIWELVFYPAQVTKSFIFPSEGIPLVISLRSLVVNLSIFPKIVTEVTLTVVRRSDGVEFKFFPYGLMGDRGVVKTKKDWEKEDWAHAWQESFRPLVIKERAHESFNLLFIPDTMANPNGKDLLPDKYEATVVYKLSRGKPIDISFLFSIDEEELNYFKDGKSFVKLHRNLSIE